MLFFAAAIQGFFLAVVLGLHRRNTQANHLLAVWIAVLSLDLLQQIYYAEKFYEAFPQLICVTNFLPLSYGGFLYLYVRSLTQDKPLKYTDLLHFSFFFFGILANIFFLLNSSADKLRLINEMMTDGPPWTIRLQSLLMPLTATVYGVLSYRLLRHPPHRGDSRFGWLRIMLWLNMLIWVLVWVAIFTPKNLLHLHQTTIYLLVSLVIYMLGYFSLRQPELFVHHKPSVATNQAPQPRTSGPKYGDNRLSDDLRDSIWAELESSMQKKALWRAANLTLTQLAETTGITSHHISQVLNDHHDLSFNDYLNRYRVEAVCSELQKDNDQNLLDIAIGCGFASKSSFNALFKKHTGKTPSEYRKQFQS